MTTLYNRAKVSTATAGTGTMTLGAAVSPAFFTFAEAGVADATRVSYVIEDGTNVEMGFGTYTVSGTTLSRDRVIASKISGTAGTTKLTLSGSATVFISALAEDVLNPAKGYLFGLTMSNAADTANDITVAAGECTDEGGTELLVLSAAITKQLDAAWAVGTNAGGINTGAEAISTWYEVHVIKRPDTGVVDVMFTTTGNRATLPANYTLQRRIGWIRNDAASAILQFTQIDDHFTLTTQVNDVAASVTTTAAAVALTAPPNSIARFRAGVESTTSVNANAGIVFSEIVEGNVTPAITTGIVSLGQWDLATGASAGHFELRVSATSTIEHDAQVGSGTFDISTYGWIDHRRKMSAT
jgi:hypothetical protein